MIENQKTGQMAPWRYSGARATDIPRRNWLEIRCPRSRTNLTTVNYQSQIGCCRAARKERQAGQEGQGETKLGNGNIYGGESLVTRWSSS